VGAFFLPSLNATVHFNSKVLFCLSITMEGVELDYTSCLRPCNNCPSAQVLKQRSFVKRTQLVILYLPRANNLAQPDFGWRAENVHSRSSHVTLVLRNALRWHVLTLTVGRPISLFCKSLRLSYRSQRCKSNTDFLLDFRKVIEKNLTMKINKLPPPKKKQARP